MPVSFRTGPPSKLHLMNVRPVHTRAARSHGFLGVSYVQKHMFVDKNWTPLSVADQFKCMTDLLVKNMIFQKLEEKALFKNNIAKSHALRKQCRDGRAKLSNILFHDNSAKIRNILRNRKDMQRLFKQMPITMVVENMSQRTFAMKKERDRLKARLELRKEVYKEKLIQCSRLENRITFYNEFVLDSEIKSRTYLKQIENSEVRLQAILTIHNTYRKMIEVLQHDSIFFEPILRSLTADVVDQANFIKHILHLGIPAIERYKALSKEYMMMEQRTNRSLSQKLLNISAMSTTSRSSYPKVKSESKVSSVYPRETFSMQELQYKLASSEETIKLIKMITLCTDAKDVHPRIKSELESNLALTKSIKREEVAQAAAELKNARARVRNEALLIKYTRLKIKRAAYIKGLKNTIAMENEREKELLIYIRNRSDVLISLRVALWNLTDILRHVDQSGTSLVTRAALNTSYLLLPLLKYEMLTMRSVAPSDYEQKIENLMLTVKRKIKLLLDDLDERSRGKTSPSRSYKYYTKQYGKQYINLTDVQEEEIDEQKDSEEESLQRTKQMRIVPSRQDIKERSARFVSDYLRGDE